MPRKILMLEHDDDDRYVTQSVFSENQYSVALEFVTTTTELFAALVAGTSGESTPSLILLNYHAGPSNAVQVIRELRGDKRFRHIPIVVLSGSVKREIINECYEAGASSFIQKPWKANETNSKIASFFKYWFETVELS